MVIIQKDLNGKTPSGGRLHQYRSKRKYESGNLPVLTAISKLVVRTFRTIGGHKKLRVVSSEFVNVLDNKNKKFVKAKIIRVVENPANRNFVRSNTITRGALVETDKGNVKITNRPGQDGVLNGVLV